MILFTDIVGSTERMASIGVRGWQYLLDAYYNVIRQELRSFGGLQVGDTGDGCLALFDLPASAIHCAAAIREGVKVFNVEIRAGLHAGECHWTGSAVTGMAVHIAARTVRKARPGELLASSMVKDLAVGHDLVFVDRGTYRLKGVPDEWRLYAVVLDGRDSSSHTGRRPITSR